MFNLQASSSQASSTSEQEQLARDLTSLVIEKTKEEVQLRKLKKTIKDKKCEESH